MLRVLVCGGREYKDAATLFNYLDELRQQTGDVFIIQGGAKGADLLAKSWANSRGQPMAEVPANWYKFGKPAGHMRNAWMLLLEPDLVVAFPGGTGTAGMVKMAKSKDILVRVVK